MWYLVFFNLFYGTVLRPKNVRKWNVSHYTSLSPNWKTCTFNTFCILDTFLILMPFSYSSWGFFVFPWTVLSIIFGTMYSFIPCHLYCIWWPCPRQPVPGAFASQAAILRASVLWLSSRTGAANANRGPCYIINFNAILSSLCWMVYWVQTNSIARLWFTSPAH